MIENRYANRPYGWPAWKSLLLVARLIVLGEISLVMDGAVLPATRCTRPHHARQVAEDHRRQAAHVRPGR